MATTAGRQFDPNRKYNVVLSDRLKDGNSGAYSLNTVQVDPDIKLPTKVVSSQIKPSTYTDEYNLHLNGAKDGEKHVYSGTRQPANTCALIFNPATQNFVLDRIDEDYSFANEHTGDGTRSEDGLIGALIEQEGEADPDNPYDWRHQLTQMQNATPSPDPFEQLELESLDSPSPEMPRVPSHRQASTPPGEFSAQSRSESEQEDNGFELEIEQEPPRRGRQRQPEPEMEEIESDASSEGGGLEIIMDGSSKRPKVNRSKLFEQDGDGPISLRSAANSRSPALRGNQRDEDSDDESDEDVDEMKLGSPMQETRKQDRPQPEEDDNMDDYEDDFDAELAADLDEAFAQEEGVDNEQEADTGGGVPIGKYVEASSSESEEE